MDQSELGYLTVLLLIFVTTPAIPDTILFSVDHWVIRILLILLVFAALRVNHMTALFVLLVVGSLFVERNSRKFRRAHEGAAEDGDVPVSFIERVMSPFKAPRTPGPTTSKHTYVDDGSYDNNESPIADTAASVGERPVLDGAQGDSHGLSMLDKIADMFA
jgi:hypothetical protein